MIVTFLSDNCWKRLIVTGKVESARNRNLQLIPQIRQELYRDIVLNFPNSMIYNRMRESGFAV
jgi:hypothetical protein